MKPGYLRTVLCMALAGCGAAPVPKKGPLEAGTYQGFVDCSEFELDGLGVAAPAYKPRMSAQVRVLPNGLPSRTGSDGLTFLPEGGAVRLIDPFVLVDEATASVTTIQTFQAASPAGVGIDMTITTTAEQIGGDTLYVAYEVVSSSPSADNYGMEMQCAGTLTK